MTDRRPLALPGRIGELEDTDRAILSGIVRTLAGSLTFEDAVSGATNLANLVAAGRTAISAAADTTALLTWTVQGTNGAIIEIFVGNRDPLNNVTANPGAWYFRDSTTTSGVYVHRGASANNTGWVALSVGGLTGSLGSTDNVIPRTVGAGGSTLEASLGAIEDDGSLFVLGTSATSSQPAAVIGHSGGTNERLYIYSRDNTPKNNVTHNPASGQGICFDKSQGMWQHFGAGSDDDSWYQVAAFPRMIHGYQLSWTSANALSVAAGWLTDVAGRVHATSAPITLSTTVGLVAPGSLDTGTMTASRWYYVWLIRNAAGAYSCVFSLSNTTPTLAASSFTTPGYVAVARIGCFRTTSVAATVVEFYQNGLFNTRTYVHDESSSAMIALNAGTSTSQTTIGHSAGAGALPITAIEADVTIDTNATSGVAIAYSTSQSNIIMANIPASSASYPLTVKCLNGTFTYDNNVALGDTLIRVTAYTEEVPFS